MGTRCEIHIRTKYQTKNEVVQLWKHWDGYPDSMKDTFTDFGEFMKKSCGDQPHRLFYPGDLASLLIAFSYLESVKQNEMLEKSSPGKNRECYPDIRPRGNIEDCEYVYLLEITSPDNTYANAGLHVKCYDSVHDDKLIAQFENGTEGAPVPYEDDDPEKYDYIIPLNLGPQSGLMAN